MSEPARAAVGYGIDIGGTKIELVACDGALQVLHRRRIATPQGDYDGFLAALETLIGDADAQLAGAARVQAGAAVGIAISLGTTIVYLLMINLAQAVGWSGLLDPVAAAWLPNGVFLLVGLWLLVRVRT